MCLFDLIQTMAGEEEEEKKKNQYERRVIKANYSS